jgi:signal transduction histidine kinase
MPTTQILVVEDEGLVATALQSELEQFGYTVSGIAGSGNEAVRQAVEGRPDLVLMDIHLQGEVDGVEAARQIQARCGVPVVYLSAFSDDETVARAADTNAFGYLLKPYEERELHTTIEMAIAKHRAEQARERARRAQKMEAASRLAGGLAQHLNQLLTAILGNTSLALTVTPTEAESQPMLEQIERAAQRATELVQRLLMFSSLSGRPLAQLQRVDLGELIPTCLRGIQPHLDDRIVVRFKSGPNPWPVAADELLLGQALLELAMNAQDAMPHGGRLSVEIENMVLSESDLANHPQGRSGEFVRVRVSDTGRGMKPTVRSQIFEPCFTTKETGQASGLGLALVFAAIEQQHGWIECQSQVNRGTQLDLFLPRYGGDPSSVT